MDDLGILRVASESPPPAAPHATGTVRSGDVDIFYRRFGSSGATPLLILHGANYYDSSDWIPVAQALADDREVVAYDARGYGESGWSESQDYSLDAQLADILALLDEHGWTEAILVGHSRGGLFTLRFAHAHPERTAGVALIDFSPDHAPGRPAVAPLRTGPLGPVYATLTDAHAATSRNPGELETSAGRARVATIFASGDGGWVNAKRDPSFQNDRPNDRPEWVPVHGPLDLWQALRGLHERGAPALVVRGTRSPVYDSAALARLRSESPGVVIAEVDSGHDVPGAAPTELVGAIRAFV